MNTEFTKGQKQMLLKLTRDEAMRLGYGTKYWDDTASDRRAWPPKLKRLASIARKLHYQLGHYDGDM